MPSDYTRERGERFHSKGLRTGSPADALQPGQYPYLQNVRGTTDTEITTRAGHVLEFSTTFAPVKNIGSYTQGTTTRFVAACGGYIFLDNGAIVDSGYATDIPSILPFRPNASPQPWLYVGDSVQYHKLSPPSATNVVTAQNVGIEEPQSPPGIVLDDSPAQIVFAQDAAGHWTNTGACGSVSNGTRSTDTIASILRDPLSFTNHGPVTLQTGVGIIYQKDEFLNWPDPATGNTIGTRINDVFAPLPNGLAISEIYYLSGTTGTCIVVPDLLAAGPGDGFSIETKALLASLRRGALVTIGTEVCYVQDVELSPFGSVSFTTSTTGAHTSAEPLGGVPGIQLFRQPSVDALTVGTPISSYQWQFHCNSGVGSVQENMVTGLFLSNGNERPFQPDDYLTFGVFLVNPENLIEMKVVINVTAGSVNYTEDAYYYAVRQSDIEAGLQNTLTKLGVAQIYSQRELIDEEASAGYAPASASSAQAVPGASQWSQIKIRIQDLIRIGNNQTRTLTDMLGIQFLFNCTGSGTDAAISSITVRGEKQMDVGDAGVPYRYRVRGRSSLTGARSNPSPPTRYGWSPSRQSILVFPPASPDPQVDLWDIFRIGGSLDSYRLVGTIDMTVSYFEDDYADIAVANAEELDFDNLQPWPTLDLPLSIPASTVNGYIINFSLPSGDPHLATIDDYLPGNLVRINETVYTLYNRPILSGLNVQFQLTENAGAGFSSVFIYEPLMANQTLPFLWGPSAEGGTVFGCGDPFRPGNVYFAKNFNPDSAPDKYNLELSPPSEPLTGGCLLNGESYVFSAVRCWALRPSFGGINQYTPRQVPTGVGAVSHFAICSDGKHIYFVAKDGIYATAGGVAQSLTSRESIYTLFPYEGQQGQPWSYVGFTAYPPDYTQTSGFRLAYGNGFLYFDYPDTNGGISHLVYDIKHAAWYIDTFPTGSAPSGTITGVVVKVSSPILAGASETCTAIVSGTGGFSSAVVWTVISGGGTITSLGVYTAPSVATSAVIRAVSVQDPTKFGQATISVVLGTITGVSVSPPTASIVVNASLQLTATVSGTGTFDPTVSWSIFSGGGTVSPTGLFTAPGSTVTTDVRATSNQDGTKHGDSTITITGAVATLVSIAVTPANATIVLAVPTQYTATGTYSDSSTRNISGSVTWSSTFSGIITIDPTGVVEGVGVGSDNVIATLGAISGSTPVIVQPPADFLVYITVTPVSPSVAVLGTQAFTATGTYHLGETKDLTAVAAWSSDNTGIATVNSSGVASGVALGTTNIHAKYPAVPGLPTLIDGSTSITVTSSPVTIWRPTTYIDQGGIPTSNPWLAFDGNTSTAAVVSASVDMDNNLGGDIIYNTFAPSHVLSGSENLNVIYDYTRGGNGHLQIRVNGTPVLTVTATTATTTFTYSLASFTGQNVNTLSVEIIVICIGFGTIFGNSSDIYEIFVQ